MAKSKQTARETVLGAIARANAAYASESSAASYESIDRSYERSGALPGSERLDLFAERLHDYDAAVTRTTAEGLAASVEASLTALGVRRLLVPASVPDAWLTAGVEVVRDDALPVAELDRFDAVLTGCEVAIAFTGSIVLTAQQGRRAPTLIPDRLICVVFAEQVVQLVPEAFARLQSSAAEAMTFISGPSATSDIEMSRIKGVHGPRKLDVILVG